MKKILLIVCAALISIISFAQDVHFYCFNINEDINKLNECRSGNIEWAENLLKIFPLSSDGYISHTYTIESSDSLKAKRVMIVIHNWMNSLFKSPDTAIKQIDNVEHTIFASASFGILGQENGLTRASRITADHDLKVEVHEKSIVIKMRVRHYQLAGFNAFKGANGDLVNINTVFPVGSNNMYRPAFAQAFINANSLCLTTSKGLLEYINQHYNTITEDETW